MEKNECFYFGKIFRVHGYKGELKIFVDADNPLSYKGLDMVFIEVKGKLIPYFIDNIHFENNRANLKLQDVDELGQAERLVGCEIYLPLEKLPKLKGNKFYYHEVVDFKVFDKKHGEIGKVEKVLDLPNNALFSIRYHEKEILVPIIEEIIKKVDRTKKEIFIEAPEGLIDIYLD